MSVNFSGTDYYYVANIQGDIMAILNTSGEPVVQYNYDAWGKLLSTTGTLADTLGEVNPLTYRGYVYDHDSGYYYLQSRYYDPEVGRFINADGLVTTGQGLLGNNMFVYCNNNPIILSDAQGTAPWPTTVMIREGFYGSYRKKGPSSVHSPQPIPAEYGGDVAVNFKHLMGDVADLGLGARKIRTGKKYFDWLYLDICSYSNTYRRIMGIG